MLSYDLSSFAMSSISSLSNGSCGIDGHDDCLPDKFLKSVVACQDYPTNLVLPNKPEYQLQECLEQLNDNERVLFGRKNDVNLVEIREGHKDPEITCIKHVSELSAVGIDQQMSQSDPGCRFVFISAPNSRAKLDIERPLLSQILTWHQVMPQFVDFLLAFGISEHAKDFLYSGFRSEMDLDPDYNKLRLESLGRSGCEIRMCHILRSMERVESESQKGWPWALRPAATYHSFDVETRKSVWMIVKANDLIRERVEDSIDENDLYQSFSEGGLDYCFESTLSTHLILCAWAAENWRWYINFIENRIQDLTRGALTDQTQSSQFSFEDLQKVHFVEEKANEALLVLRSNAAVMRDLRQFYSDAADALDTVYYRPSVSVSSGSVSPAIAKFQHLLDATAKDLAMQQARAEMLLKLLADRKSLLTNMLEWRNAQVNLDLALKAQTSAAEMESMTKAMHTLASETKMEAANMRIITLVTLFFLPGTFVSVSVTLSLVTALKLTPKKTLMSTPIVHYPDHQQVINHDALNLFLEIALPLLAATLMTWYCLYRWHKARRAKPEEQLQSWMSKLRFRRQTYLQDCKV